MKIIMTILFSLLAFSLFGQEEVTTNDLNASFGFWEGELTYLDYQSGKPFRMPANLEVKQGKNKKRLILKNL